MSSVCKRIHVVKNVFLICADDFYAKIGCWFEKETMM